MASSEIRTRLSQTNDRDLIQWLSNIPKGKQGEIIREVLRRGIGLVSQTSLVLNPSFPVTYNSSKVLEEITNISNESFSVEDDFKVDTLLEGFDFVS